MKHESKDKPFKSKSFKRAISLYMFFPLCQIAFQNFGGISGKTQRRGDTRVCKTDTKLLFSIDTERKMLKYGAGVKMRSIHKKYVPPILPVLFCLLLCCSCDAQAPSPAPAQDPYAGSVLVPDGTGKYIRVPLHEELPANPLSEADFASVGGNFIEYTGNGAVTVRGIDVSYYQGDIDWEKVAGDGAEFAVIRAGYRGYSKGDVYEDENFRRNYTGAVAAGMQVGVYFFSQAISVGEAAEEAEFTSGLLDGRKLDLPVMFDWERIGGGARTDGVSGKILTDACIAFCNIIKEAGYEPGVYFYRDLGYNTYELERLSELTFWVGALGDYPDFYYRHGMWQYSVTGRVAGIEGDVDLNIRFVKIIGAG